MVLATNCLHLASGAELIPTLRPGAGLALESLWALLVCRCRSTIGFDSQTLSSEPVIPVVALVDLWQVGLLVLSPCWLFASVLVVLLCQISV